MSTIYRNYNELMRARGEMTYLGHQKLLLLVVLQTVNHEETDLGYFPTKSIFVSRPSLCTQECFHRAFRATEPEAWVRVHVGH